MQLLSAVLIIKNEEAFIERALTSLTFCDEIVVVDAESTDRTAEICKNPDAPWAKKLKWVSHSWEGFSAQRNFALKHTSHDWVLFLDGDEAVSPDLAHSIQRTLASPSLLPTCFKIRRQEFFLGKPIHHGIWNPSCHPRLFFKPGFQFVGTVHEGIKTELPLQEIHEPIIHVENLTIERFLTKLNHYTTLQAENDYRGGMRTSIARILLSFPAMFYKNYIYYGAYKDGTHGVMISVLEGISRTVRHLKIWQLQVSDTPPRS
jgi:glycosyltransferase involved in cell wall biosynthesis